MEYIIILHERMNRGQWRAFEFSGRALAAPSWGNTGIATMAHSGKACMVDEGSNQLLRPLSARREERGRSIRATSCWQAASETRRGAGTVAVQILHSCQSPSSTLQSCFLLHSSITDLRAAAKQQKPQQMKSLWSKQGDLVHGK